MARRSVRLGEPRSVCIPRRQPHPKPSPGSSTWQLCAWQLLGRQSLPKLPMGQHSDTQKPNCTQRNLRGPECCSPAQRAAGAAEAAAPPLPFQHGSHKAAAPRADRVHMGSPWDLHGSPWVSMGLHRSPWDLRGISMGLPVSTWVSMDLRRIRVASPRVFGDPRRSSHELNMFYPRSHWDLRGSTWDPRGIFVSLHEVLTTPLVGDGSRRSTIS